MIVGIETQRRPNSSVRKKTAKTFLCQFSHTASQTKQNEAFPEKRKRSLKAAQQTGNKAFRNGMGRPLDGVRDGTARGKVATGYTNRPREKYREGRQL